MLTVKTLQKVSISNAEKSQKSQTTHVSVDNRNFLFPLPFHEDQHTTHGSYAYLSIYLMAQVLINETQMGNIIISRCKIPQRHGMTNKRNKSSDFLSCVIMKTNPPEDIMFSYMTSYLVALAKISIIVINTGFQHTVYNKY